MDCDLRKRLIPGSRSSPRLPSISGPHGTQKGLDRDPRCPSQLAFTMPWRRMCLAGATWMPSKLISLARSSVGPDAVLAGIAGTTWGEDRRLLTMTVTVDLPDVVLRRLKAEADRRGIALDELLAEIAEGFADEAQPSGQAEGLRRLTGIAPGISGLYSRDEDWPE